MQRDNTGLGIMMVTHYTRILKYIKPDIVHVFADGHIVETAGPELADYLEEHGYDKYLPEGTTESAQAQTPRDCSAYEMFLITSS